MKKSPFLLLFLTAASAFTPSARADVAWNHVGSIKIGNTPLLTFSMQNQWSGTDHRVALNVDASKLANGIAPSNATPVKAQFQVIERLDADRLIISSPQSKTYFDEPYKNLKSRLRINFWEALGSNLSADTIPELTLEQRRRLGQELRAVITPFTKNITRTYFRALPNRRVINGMPSRGFRFTSAVNVSTVKSRPEWIRAAGEWWLAEGMAGDEEIRAFTQSANQLKSGPASASMWANEYAPVLWQAAPEQAHQALASLIGATGSPNYGFQGTPVQFFVTISGPPAAQMGMGGDLKFSLELKNRHTNAALPATFEAPGSGAQRIELEPFLGMARNFIKMAPSQLESLMK